MKLMKKKKEKIVQIVSRGNQNYILLTSSGRIIAMESSDRYVDGVLKYVFTEIKVNF